MINSRKMYKVYFNKKEDLASVTNFLSGYCQELVLAIESANKKGSEGADLKKQWKHFNSLLTRLKEEKTLTKKMYENLFAVVPNVIQRKMKVEEL